MIYQIKENRLILKAIGPRSDIYERFVLEIGRAKIRERAAKHNTKSCGRSTSKNHGREAFLRSSGIQNFQKYNEPMNYPTVFDLIAGELGKAGIPYVLAGGFAVNAHHVTRQTLDVDLLIGVDDLEKASCALRAAGYQKGLESPVVARFKGNGKLFLDIDLMLLAPGTLRKIMEKSQMLTLAGHTFRVLSLEHLIAMKFHAIKNDPESRESKDLLDIIQLARRNGMDVQGPQLQKLCETYGTPEVFKKIQILTKGSL